MGECLFLRWWAGLTTGILIVLAIAYVYRLFQEAVRWDDWGNTP